MKKKIKIIGLFLGATLLASSCITTSIALASCNGDNKNDDLVSDGNKPNNDNNGDTVSPKPTLVKVDCTKIFDELNKKLLVDDWNDENKTKIEEQIEIGLKASLFSPYKDKITLKKDSIVVTQPTESNIGTIKFKVDFNNKDKKNWKIKLINNQNSNVNFNQGAKMFTVTNLTLKNTIKLDSKTLFNTLNRKFTYQEWSNETKLTEAFKNILVNAVTGDDKNKINCIINNDPVIPTSIASNDGIINFKITAPEGVEFEIKNTINVFFDEKNNVVSIANLNLIKPVEITIDLKFVNWIMKFIQDASDTIKTGTEFGNFLRTNLINAICEKLGFDYSKYINPWNIWMDKWYSFSETDNIPDNLRQRYNSISYINITFNNATIVANGAINVWDPTNNVRFDFQDNALFIPLLTQIEHEDFVSDEMVSFVNQLVEKNNVTTLNGLRDLISTNSKEIFKKVYYINENNQKVYLNPNDLIGPIMVEDSYQNSFEYEITFATKKYTLVNLWDCVIKNIIQTNIKIPTNKQFYNAWNILNIIAKSTKNTNEFTVVANALYKIVAKTLGIDDNDINLGFRLEFCNYNDGGSTVPIFDVAFSQNVFPYYSQSAVQNNPEFIENECDMYTKQVAENLYVQYAGDYLSFVQLNATSSELDKICKNSQIKINYTQDFYNEFASIIEIDQYATKWANNEVEYLNFLETKLDALTKLLNKHIDSYEKDIDSVKARYFKIVDGKLIFYYNRNFVIGYLYRQFFDSNIPIKPCPSGDSYRNAIQIALSTTNSANK